MKLIVGLGNPGRIYKYSRHNIGFLLINRLAKSWGIKIRRDLTANSFVGRGKFENIELILAFPLCFMNLSGRTINQLLRKYNLDPKEDMLVVCDDLDLRWGEIRIRPKGSSGGHKGIKSVIEALGNPDFSRLRIGIGRPRMLKGLSQTRKKDKLVDYVLSSFTRRQKSQLSGYLKLAADCCQTWMTSGISQAMSQFN